MTGIAQMFAEFSGDDPDWFQMQFFFERQYEIRKERNRRSARWAYLTRRHTEEYKARKRAQISRYAKHKRQTDPAWVEARRKRNRETMARLRAAARTGGASGTQPVPQVR